jgi:hypothetical protein
MSRRRPAMPTPGPRCGMTGLDSPWTGMPPMWSRPSSPQRPADPRRPERYHAHDPPSRAGTRAVARGSSRRDSRSVCAHPDVPFWRGSGRARERTSGRSFWAVVGSACTAAPPFGPRRGG